MQLTIDFKSFLDRKLDLSYKLIDLYMAGTNIKEYRKRLLECTENNIDKLEGEIEQLHEVTLIYLMDDLFD